MTYKVTLSREPKFREEILVQEAGLEPTEDKTVWMADDSGLRLLAMSVGSIPEYTVAAQMEYQNDDSAHQYEEAFGLSGDEDAEREPEAVGLITHKPEGTVATTELGFIITSFFGGNFDNITSDFDAAFMGFQIVDNKFYAMSSDFKTVYVHSDDEGVHECLEM